MIPRGGARIAEKLAARVRRRAGVRPSTIISALAIAERLGVPVMVGLKQVGPGYYSTRTREILVSRAVEARAELRNDTIGHELGHHAIRTMTTAKERTLLDGSDRGDYALEEACANWFAGALLMPAPWFAASPPRSIAGQAGTFLERATLRRAELRFLANGDEVSERARSRATRRYDEVLHAALERGRLALAGGQ